MSDTPTTYLTHNQLARAEALDRARSVLSRRSTLLSGGDLVGVHVGDLVYMAEWILDLLDDDDDDEPEEVEVVNPLATPPSPIPDLIKRAADPAA